MAVSRWRELSVTRIAREKRDPFLVLISTILSLRTKDECTAEASERLFRIAPDLESMRRLSEKKIAEVIFPVGFYNVKAKNIKSVCEILTNYYEGRVPEDIEELLKLPGVGRKTANLVVTKGYDKPGICVDIHVHRICNRWGYVNTKTPDKTEFRLREILPEKYWMEINDLLVAFGKKICAPVSPKCSQCPLSDFCPARGVTRRR